MNSVAWTASKIGVAFIPENYNNAETNATAAGKYLVSLESLERGRGTDPLSDYVLGAISDHRWGPNASKKDATYATDITKCAKALDAGNWDAAMQALGK